MRRRMCASRSRSSKGQRAMSAFGAHGPRPRRQAGRPRAAGHAAMPEGSQPSVSIIRAAPHRVMLCPVCTTSPVGACGSQLRGSAIPAPPSPRLLKLSGTIPRLHSPARSKRRSALRQPRGDVRTARSTRGVFGPMWAALVLIRHAGEHECLRKLGMHWRINRRQPKHQEP